MSGEHEHDPEPEISPALSAFVDAARSQSPAPSQLTAEGVQSAWESRRRARQIRRGIVLSTAGAAVAASLVLAVFVAVGAGADRARSDAAASYVAQDPGASPSAAAADPLEGRTDAQAPATPQLERWIHVRSDEDASAPRILAPALLAAVALAFFAPSLPAWAVSICASR